MLGDPIENDPEGPFDFPSISQESDRLERSSGSSGTRPELEGWADGDSYNDRLGVFARRLEGCDILPILHTLENPAWDRSSSTPSQLTLIPWWSPKSIVVSKPVVPVSRLVLT